MMKMGSVYKTGNSMIVGTFEYLFNRTDREILLISHMLVHPNKMCLTLLGINSTVFYRPGTPPLLSI